MAGYEGIAPTLAIQGPSVPSRLVTLDVDHVSIGRDPASNVWLNLKQVSWKHARIVRTREGSYAIEDLESYNSTHLDGRKLTPRVPASLRDGSRVRICDVTLEFRREAVQVESDETTIVGTISDLSSVALAAQTEDAPAVLRAVLEINTVLGGRNDLNEMLGRALDSLFKVFGQAECGFILTREPDGNLAPRATRRKGNVGPTPTLSRKILEKVLREGRAVLVTDGRIDQGGDGPPESWSSAGIRTAVCVPIPGHEGAPVGVIQIDSRVRPGSFVQSDLELLAAVAIPIGTAVENFRMLQEKASLAAAGEVQAALLPRKRPVLPGYGFWERYQPAYEVGGDYYDYVQADPAAPGEGTALTVALGDVSGKGMPAALLVANLSAEVRHLVRAGFGASEVVARSNRHVYEADLPGRFVTFLAMRIDAAPGKLTVGNAGHAPPFLRRADGTVETVGGVDDSGLPLGIEPDVGYPTVEVALRPGDVVVAFTDGVNEAMNRADLTLGLDAVRGAVAGAGPGPAAVGEAVLRLVREHAGDRRQFDDIAIVCFGRDAV